MTSLGAAPQPIRNRLGPHPDLIAAMRATSIAAPQECGLWYVERYDGTTPATDAIRAAAHAFFRRNGAYDQYPDIPPVMTSLCRWTDATLHLGKGEPVMSDDPRELRKHLPIVLEASGRVLVSGLGLGCVVRGLLARPAVEHVDVVEIDDDVLAMVAPAFADEPRLTIHEGDALTYAWPSGTRWNFAWHDVWSETPHTQVVHLELLDRYRRLVGHQGAWGMERWMKRMWRGPLLGGDRRSA